MSVSVVEIYNQALSAIGHTGAVSDVAENSREADVCNLWYPLVRDTVMRSAWWPSVRATTSLALLSTRNLDVAWVGGDPAPTFKYAYKAPSDMLSPRYLATYARFDQGIGQDGGQDVAAIFTDATPALLEYARSGVSEGLWDVGLRMAIVYALAAKLAQPITGKAALANSTLQQAMFYVGEAKTEANNVQPMIQQGLADWHAARGYSMSTALTRYVFPLEQLQSLAI